MPASSSDRLELPNLRNRALLVGPDPDVRSDVAGAMVGGALMMIGAAPELDHYADDELSTNLLELARDLLDRHVGQKT
ncbi:MAG: hypothetical protein QOD98_2309 [Nocardioidaceae bacterium]|jgi:hypothetical protein|nr:hypothetical protein [Nocardioidaceae bacterium]